MGDDDVLIVHAFEERGEFVDVHVAAGVGAFGVLVFEEGALGEEDFAVADIVELRKVDVLGIAQIADEGDFDGVVDGDALLFEFYQFIAGQAVVFGFEFFSCFDDAEADGVAGVFGREDTGDEVGLDAEFVAGADGDEVGRDAAAVEASPGVEDLTDGVDGAGRGEDGSLSLAAEFAMGQVVGNARGVVHVAVGEQDVVDGDDLVGGFADVKADVKLRDGDNGLFTADRVAEDIQVVDRYMC